MGDVAIVDLQLVDPTAQWTEDSTGSRMKRFRLGGFSLGLSERGEEKNLGSWHWFRLRLSGKRQGLKKRVFKG
jgi:hypothetical protein